MAGSRKHGLHLAKTIGAGLCTLLLAACGGGGGGSSGPVAATETSSGATSTATLAWAPADGPVAGYRIYVKRDGGPFRSEVDINQSTVTLKGKPGQTARIQVAAFDSMKRLGPVSPASPQFKFPAVGSGTTPPTSASASAAAASAPVTGASGSRVGSTDGDAPPEEPKSVDAADLAGGLVWQADGMLRVTDASLETQLSFARPADDAALAAVADFDADGRGDLLWSTLSGQLFYTPIASLVDVSATPVVEIGELAEGERVAGAGDFDGDGYGDLLVVGAADAVDVWYTTSGAAEIARVGVASGATLAGLADFDANGTDDAAWRGADGALVFWLMDGVRAAATVEVPLGTGWTVLAAGDFDGDAAAELAMRDANGAVSIYYPLVAPDSVATTDLVDTLGWTTAGSSDVDRDGMDDLVLVDSEALRLAYLPGETSLPLDPSAPWRLVALLP